MGAATYQSKTYSKLPVVELVGNEQVTFFRRLSGLDDPLEPVAAAAMGQELSSDGALSK